MTNDVSPYIDIVEVGTSPSGKTKTWEVRSKRTPDDIPGHIFWHGPWRKYVYSSTDAIYDWKCLRQIANFCEVATKDHLS